MLKIVAKRYLKENSVEAYTELARELVDFTRSEEGCVDYGLYYDKAKNLAVMMETWESQYHLDKHLETIIAAGWPAKLNSFADPTKQGGVEKFEQLY